MRRSQPRKDIQGIGISCGGPLDSNTVINKGYIDDKYVLLYHINFGYPFLDEEMKIEMPIIKSEGLTDFARSRKELQLKITPPIDGGDEEVFYNNLEEGCVGLKSEKLGIECELRYDIANFPVTLQWKSMISGDFALGIEPSVTRFDDFKMLTLKSQEKKRYSVSTYRESALSLFDLSEVLYTASPFLSEDNAAKYRDPTFFGEMWGNEDADRIKSGLKRL